MDTESWTRSLGHGGFAEAVIVGAANVYGAWN